MAFYMDAKRIPPERLVDRPPQEYDRILQTFDIDGARSKIKNFQPESHGYSLKTNDIQGAQPRRKIRNIWGKYDYNPTDKNLSLSQAYLPKLQQTMQAQPAGIQPYHNIPKTKEQSNQSSVNLQDGNNEDKIFHERRHNLEPRSQIKQQQIFRPAEALQPYLDYDKVVTPYQKKYRDQQILEKHQKELEAQGNIGKHNDLPYKMESYRQTQDRMNKYDPQQVEQYVKQNQESSQFNKNYEEFYRGYTPTSETQKQYPQTKTALEQKALQLSQNAQMAQKNLQVQPQTTSNAQRQQYSRDNINQAPEYYDNNNYSQPDYVKQQNQPDYSQQQLPRLNSQQQQQQSLTIDPQAPNKPPSAGMRRQYQGSQSVSNINTQSWNNFRYNPVGGFIEDKREYKRDQSSAIEKQYYDNYSQQRAEEMRKSQNQPTKPYASQAPNVKLDYKSIDHNDQGQINEIEKQLNKNRDNIKFGRSQLFDEFLIKPNIASHQRQFIGNTIPESMQSKFPQRYGPVAMKNFSNNIMDN